MCLKSMIFLKLDSLPSLVFPKGGKDTSFNFNWQFVFPKVKSESMMRPHLFCSLLWPQGFGPQSALSK